MADKLEIYNNGVRVIMEDEMIPIQLVFKNEDDEITGHSIVSIDRLKAMIFSSGDEFSWFRTSNAKF